MLTRWGVSTPAMLSVLSLIFAGGTFAQNQPANSERIPLTVQAGVPLHVVLEEPASIKHAGEPVKGRVLRPIYVFDRLVIPAGSEVRGRVTKVDSVSRTRRLESIANGNFTPLHKAHLEFDALVLKDGRRLPVQTVVLQGSAGVVHLTAGGQHRKKGTVSGALAQARRQVKQREQQAVQAIKAPGKLKRLEGALSAELPYHKQLLPAGTHFTAELKTPLALGTEARSPKDLERLGAEIPPGSTVEARLVTPLSSATSQRGSRVEAVVSKPVFSSDHHLILPQGARLEGTVTRAVPAHRLGRNGKLRFSFRRIEFPHQPVRNVEASLQGVEVSKAAHLKLDTEGGARVVNSKKRFIAPAIDVLLATSSLDGFESHPRAIQETSGEGGGAAGGVVRGGAGFGLVGSLVALLARSQPVTAGFAFYGAAWSIYSHVVARGSNVVFPKDTPMEIRFGTHETSALPDSRRAMHPSRKTKPTHLS